MSTTTIRRRFKIDGVLADADAAVFSDPLGAYGVRRTDTGADVVPEGTALTRVSAGVYSYAITDPAPGLTYEFYIKFTFGGEDYWVQDSKLGGHDGSLYDLIPRIAPYVGGCPDAVVKQNLRDIAREYCRLTGIFTADLDVIDSVADQDAYALVFDYDARIWRVRGVTYDGTPARYTVDEAAETITLGFTPQEAGKEIVASVTFLPNEPMTEYPAWILERHGHGIVAGTLARLCSMLNRPWGDAATVQRCAPEYRAAVAEAKGLLITKRGAPNQRIQVGPFV